MEFLSRGLMGVIGVWMIWRGLRRGIHNHDQSEGLAFGFFAGLIPCPLTLFVMTYSITRGVPEAGIAFAVAMMFGIGLALSALAIITVLFRTSVTRLLENKSSYLEAFSRTVEVLVGLILAIVALREVYS